MSMKMMNAAYLVDNVALLSLQEKQDGVEFHCFDMDSKVQIAEGHIGWDVLDKQPFSTLEESARMAALQKIPQVYKLGICFPFQLVDEIPTEETDIKMDAIMG